MSTSCGLVKSCEFEKQGVVGWRKSAWEQLKGGLEKAKKRTTEVSNFKKGRTAKANSGDDVGGVR